MRYRGRYVRAGTRQRYKTSSSGGGSSFNPKDITGCVACWVADDCSSVGDGAAVSSWVDRKNNLNLAQATGTKQPLYRASGIGTAPAIDFDGTDDLLVYAAANAVSTAQSGHIFAVIRGDATTAAREDAIACTSDEASTSRLVGVSREANKLYGRQANGSGFDAVFGGTTLGATTSYLIEFGSSGTVFSMRVNGTAETLGVSVGSDSGDWFGDSTARDNFTVGGKKTTSESAWFDGRIAFVLVVDGTIASGDRTSLHAWVAAKYGLTLA